MALQTKMWLLVALLFAIVYGAITAIGAYLGLGGTGVYVVVAVLFMGLQYLVGPALVSMLMKVKYVAEAEEPELHHMVAELAREAGIPKPKVGISQLSIPNAFAFGRSQRDGRICVTTGIRSLLTRDELKAVIGHEMSHLRARDMMVITLLSVVPLIFYFIAQNIIWGGALGDKRDRGGWTALIGVGAMAVYFITNLLVLYGSRIREYAADEGSVRIGNQPHQLASALYKLVYASAHLPQTAKVQHELQAIQGVRALFLNDTARAWQEVRDLRELDIDNTGTLDQNKLLNLRSREVKLGTSEKLIELLSTHPNMLRRVKRLAAII